jgi:hypothetical protein
MRAITCDSCPFFVRHRKLLTAKFAKKGREGRKEDIGGCSLRAWRIFFVALAVKGLFRNSM